MLPEIFLKKFFSGSDVNFFIFLSLSSSCKIHYNFSWLLQVRTGFFEGKNRIDSLITDIGYWGTSAVTIHGRSRQQRYSKLANWDYIYQCARKAPDDLQVLGNGDVFSYLDWNMHKTECPVLATSMIARGALIKVCVLELWLYTTPPPPPPPRGCNRLTIYSQP